MRFFLTIIAVALVALLTAALVAPLFIDWSAHRAEIEARLGAATGARVALGGPITLRFLPVPYLDVGAGSATAPGPDAPKLSFEKARLELALAKLASGKIRFSEIRLEKPVLTLVRAPDGSLDFPAPPSEADAVGFDALVAHDGTIRITGPGGPARTIEGVDLDADAPSLAGPYRISGKFSGPGGAPVAFRLVTEQAGPLTIPIRASVDAGPVWPALEFDGALAFSGAKNASLSGTAALIGAAASADGPIPWRVDGRMSADLSGATLAQAQFRLGPEERALRAEGSLALALDSPPRLTIEAKAKQANIDAFLRRKGEDGVPPARALAMLSSALSPALVATGTMTVNADVSAGDVILGSQTLSGLSASVRAAPGAPLETRFSAGLPGQSRLSGDGDLETGAAAKFKGAIDFSSGDLAALGAWANQGEGSFGAKIVALGEALENRGASLSGDVEVSAVGLSGRSLRIALDRSMLTGALAFTSPVGADPGRLFMDLSSDLLDVEALPSVNASAALIGDLDLSLSLRANALHVARVGDTQVSSGSLFLKVAKAGPKISLDRLSLSNLGGASVDAEGAYGPDGVTATGRLSAERLGDFAVLVSRLAPADWSRKLAERAPLLSPASLAFEAHGRPASGASLNSLTATGTIGQTRARFSLDPGPKGDGQNVSLDLDAPDSSALLHQLGLGGAATPSSRGHIGLHAAGAWGAGYDGDATGALAGVDFSMRGRLLPTAEGDDARLFGSVKLKGANVVPLASTLGLAPPGGVIGPVEASADVTLRGERWAISHLAATVAGVRTSGELAYEPPAEAAAAALTSPDLSLAEDAVNGPAADAAEPPAAIAGELSFDRLPAADLLALALGPPQPSHAGASWSETKFAAAPLNPPPIAVRVNVGTLDLADSLGAQEFSTTLRLGKGRLDLDEMAMKVSGAAASGRVTLRRDRETATLTGTLEAGAMPIAQPGFSGRVGGRLEFASTGKTPAALISGLAGAGAADFAGVELKRMNPGALDEVVAQAQAPGAQLDETNIAYEFGKALDTGLLPIPDGSTPVLLSAGALKLGPLAIARPRAAGSFSASLDLTTLALETRLALTALSAGLKFWSGPPPTAMITVHDALGAPKRRVDVAALSAGLATQAIGRESDRIAALEADIRERAFFNRRLKGERFMDKRAAEIEDWRAEHARLKGLAEHLEAERAQAERAAAEKAAAEKAAADKAAAEKAAAKAAAEVANEKAVAIKPQLPPDLPADVAPDADQGGIAVPAAAPLPPTRPKPRPAPADPTANGLY